jgi:predicted N-formylglutamate amidohydrolase
MAYEPFEILNIDGEAPLLLICDHASNYIPTELNNLGLNRKKLKQHIAWDIGAANLTRKLSKIMDAAAILCSTSRLIVDSNRTPEDGSGITEISDGVIIPGNLNLTKSDYVKRKNTYFWPYHDAIAKAITHLRQKPNTIQAVPAIFSIHTFTPNLSSKNIRPWHVGVLWNRDGRIAIPLLQQLRSYSNTFIIGDNEPYSGKEFYFSLDFHAGSAGLPHCAIEIRQDLVGNSEGINYWTKVISTILGNIITTPELHKIRYF